jgi:tRNA pseudouridine38-40 synthase
MDPERSNIEYVVSDVVQATAGREAGKLFYVVSTEEVPLDFHARKSALGKHYQYRVWNSEERTVFGNQYFYQYPGELDEEMMHKACSLLEGTHNYQGFCSAGATVKTFVRTVYHMKMRREGDWLIFDVYGNGFLYNMVRIMVGTVLDIGLNRKKLDVIPEALATQNRHLVGRTAPASGLYLKNVFYP